MKYMKTAILTCMLVGPLSFAHASMEVEIDNSSEIVLSEHFDEVEIDNGSEIVLAEHFSEIFQNRIVSLYDTDEEHAEQYGEMLLALKEIKRGYTNKEIRKELLKNKKTKRRLESGVNDKVEVFFDNLIATADKMPEDDPEGCLPCKTIARIGLPIGKYLYQLVGRILHRRPAYAESIGNIDPEKGFMEQFALYQELFMNGKEDAFKEVGNIMGLIGDIKKTRAAG